MDGGDGPRLPVADRLPGGGDQPAVVAAGGDDIADVRPFPAADHDRQVRVEVAGVDPGGLHGGVDGVDVIVAGGDHRRRLPGVVAFDPRGGDAGQVVVEGAGDDPAVRLVGVEAAGVTGAQQQRRGGFPRLREAVDLLQLLDPPGGRQLVEQAASADGLQLAWSPTSASRQSLPFRQHDELVQRRGADHAGLVHDHRRPSREPPALPCRPVRPVPFVEQLGDGVGHDAGVALQDAGSLGGRRQPEQRPSLPVQVVDGGGSMRVLPAPAGPTTNTSPSSPATAAAASACNTSSPPRSRVVDGAGGRPAPRSPT